IQDRHLRLAAEYDNYRKRTSKELADAGVRAQAFLVGRLLDALDDLGRVAHVDPTSVDAKDVLEGVELVERKMLRELEALGLERIGAVGQPFDPNDHEAIGALPAESLEQDHTVAHVLQLGYRLGPTLMRPARVQVYTWQDKSGSETEE
ncbi:MAG: nucleotide exchange factor GrpE, partial [Gemmatimonadales bacterium]